MASASTTGARARRSVLLNYYTHPKRLPRTTQAIECRGFVAVSDRSDPGLEEDVVLLVNKTREIGDAEMRRLPNLKTILVAGSEDWMLSFDREAFPVRVETIDADRGFDVAEHALALMLTGLKRLHELPFLPLGSPLRAARGLLSSKKATEAAGAHNWTGIVTRTAYKKRVGILGYGLIGRQIHKRLAGFRATVHYHSSRPYSKATEARIGASYLPVDDMLRECDIVFVQLPLTEGTTGIVGRAVLAGCRPGLTLINCGRAGTVDEDALYEAMGDARVAFYGADVAWREPRSLFDRSRLHRDLYVTPHMAESTDAAEDFTAELERALDQAMTVIE